MAHLSRLRKLGWSDEERAAALERELRTGIRLKEAMEREREIVAAEEAKMARQMKNMKSLGRHLTNMPAWEYFNLVNKYGHEEVHSKEFIRYNQKVFPHLAVNKV